MLHPGPVHILVDEHHVKIWNTFAAAEGGDLGDVSLQSILFKVHVPFLSEQLLVWGLQIPTDSQGYIFPAEATVLPE